jgi:hypothetical protein
MDLSRNISAFWKKKWLEIAGCYTDFNRDKTKKRFLPIQKKERISRIAEFLEKNPFLSEESVRILSKLAECVESAELVNEDGWLFEGPNGILAWDLDFQKKRRSMILAPRTFVVPKKHWSILGDSEMTHIVYKTRKMEASDQTKAAIKKIQRQLFECLFGK